MILVYFGWYGNVQDLHQQAQRAPEQRTMSDKLKFVCTVQSCDAQSLGSV